MAEQESRRRPVFTSVDLAAIRQMDEAGRDAGPGSGERRGTRDDDFVGVIDPHDDEGLRDLTHAIREALEHLAAVVDTDRADREELHQTLATEQHDFEQRVTATLDEFRERLANDVAAQLRAVDDKITLPANDGDSTRLDAVVEQMGTVSERLDALARQLQGVSTDLEAATAERLSAAVADVQADQAALQGAVTKATAESADRLCEAVDRVQLAAADGRDLLRQELNAAVGTVARDVSAATAEQLGGAVEEIRSDQAALQDALTKATTEAADGLWNAVDRMQAGAAEDRDRWRQELTAALASLGQGITTAAEEQERRVRAEIAESVKGLGDRWHGDLDQLRSQLEGDRGATVEALTALLTTRHDQIDGALAEHRSRLEAADQRLQSVVDTVRAENERAAQAVVERLEGAATALDEVRRRDDRVRADTAEARLDARVEDLGAKVDAALDDLKSNHAAQSASLAAKIDEATAALGDAESRLDAEAAEERTRWRHELTELLDTFELAFRLMGEGQERQLDQAIQAIRSDVTAALQRGPRTTPGPASDPRRSGGSTG